MWLVAYGRRAYGAWAETVPGTTNAGNPMQPEENPPGSPKGNPPPDTASLANGRPPASPTVIRVGVADFNGSR